MFDEPHLAPRAANYTPLTPLALLDRSVEAHRDRPAIAWTHGTLDYAGFRDLVARMAEWLRAAGIGRGDVVSVMLGNRPEMLAAHFAVPALGAVLNTLNTRLSASETAWITGHANSRLVLCDSATRDALSEVVAPVECLCAAPGETGLDLFTGPVPPLDWAEAVTDETQPIALNYTSGTTGRPKGVVITHRGAALNALGNVLALGFSAESRYLWTLPMFHCNGWCHTWAVTAAGGLHVCLDRVEPGPIAALIDRHAVTHMACAPVVIYMLLDYGIAAPGHRLRIATGGAAPTPSLLEGMQSLGFELVHAYGQTECYGPATFNTPHGDSDLDARAADLARQGRAHAMAGTARVIDESGAEVPNDGATIGEVVLRGNTVMAGYFRDEAATEAAFAGGHLHTGDLAVMHPDGCIEIRDRVRDIIISGGENLSSLEIESVLHRHPDVLIAAVVAAPHPKWGETPWAFIEPRAGADLDAETLDAFCREVLSGFKRPRRFILGPLPRTATGKIQKFLLRQRAQREASPEATA